MTRLLGTAGPNLFEALATSVDFGENALDARGPGVGNRFVVPRGKKLVDCALKLIDTAEDSASDGLSFEFCKPAFDQIEPTGAGRNKMEHEARPLAQPGADSRVTMDRIVIEDEMQACRRRKLAVEPPQEA